MPDVFPQFSPLTSETYSRQRSNTHGTEPARETVAYFSVTLPAGATEARMARGPDGRLFLAYVGGDASLHLQQYSDSDTVSGDVTVVSAGVASCSLTARGTGELDLVYVRAGGVYQRRSRDQGTTWTAETAVPTGGAVLRVVHGFDDHAGICAIAFYADADSRWYGTLGTADAAGTTWTYSAPIPLGAAGAAPHSGQLRRSSDGRWTFSYVDGGSSIQLLQCRNWAADGTGTWSSLAANVGGAAPGGSGWHNVTHWLDAPSARVNVAALALAGPVWYLNWGKWNDAGDAVTFSAPQNVGGAGLGAGSLRRERRDGIWELGVISSSGTPGRLNLGAGA